jgi:uncharacterized integral membrane protein
MPSLRERALRVRRHDNSALPDTAAERQPVDSTGPDPAPLIPEPESPPGSATSEPQPAGFPAARSGKSVRTRISGAWVAAIVAVVALVFLLIFILQNLSGAHVYFLGAAGTLPMGVAMLFAAVAGALLIALFGSARVLQLRRAARRRRH